MIKPKGCEFELQTVKAAKSGFYGDEISAHLKSCSSCRETAKVVLFFQTNLKDEPMPQHLPAAGFLWWKSRILEKRRHAELVSQPIQIAQIIAAAVAFGTFLWLLISGSLELDYLTAALNRTFASMEIIAVPFLAGIICFSIVCGALIFALRRLMPEK